MREALKELSIVSAFLLWPAVLAFGVCMFRGIRAEYREWKERKDNKDGYQYI